MNNNLLRVNKYCANSLCVNSAGAVNGVYNDKYGKRGNCKMKNMPICSIPVEWSLGSCGTQSYALTLIDYDAVPVVGFPWIHWLVANIPNNICCLGENASRHCSNIVEGLTSFAEGYQVSLPAIADFRVPKECAIGYGGFAPPDKAHVYTLTVYALSCMLNLKPGFMYNELMKEIRGKILATGQFHGVYYN